MHNSQQPPEHKLNVGVLFGGKSAEHEVSLQSAKNVLEAMDKDLFRPILIGIDKTGKWHVDSRQNELNESTLSDLIKGRTEATLMPGGQDRLLFEIERPLSPQEKLDVVFPILHGPMGEDGSVQGFLELANIPYVGPGVLGSAIGMDKDVMKRLLRDASITIADFIALTAVDARDNYEEEIIGRLGLPLFVKPANMGSSIGVSKVTSAGELAAAVKDALRFDSKVLVEKAIAGDEIECAVLGNDNPQASVVGRIIPHGNFYSYQAKYIDENGAILEIPAAIPPTIAAQAQQVAIDAFKVLSCEGMSRVDMFVRDDGSIVVNEINTIPGFTKISMYPKLWEASGMPYRELITQLIHLALERFERRKKLQTSYEGHI